jgi:hypothetical protein
MELSSLVGYRDAILDHIESQYVRLRKKFKRSEARLNGCKGEQIDFCQMLILQNQ